MHLLRRHTDGNGATHASTSVSVARIYGSLITLLVGMVLALSVTASVAARESYLGSFYTLSPHGYAAADPMAGPIRAPAVAPTAPKPRATVTANCQSGVADWARAVSRHSVGCVFGSLPLATLRDVRSMTSPVAILRASLSRWTDIIDPALVEVATPTAEAGWRAMAEFGVPEVLPSQSGPVRAGFYSLF